jgi:hypothetical protein
MLRGKYVPNPGDERIDITRDDYFRVAGMGKITNYDFSRLLTPSECRLPVLLVNSVGRGFPAGARQYL